MRNLTIAIALFGLAGTTSAAYAEGLDRPCTDKTESAYLPFAALSAKVAEQATRSAAAKSG